MTISATLRAALAGAMFAWPVAVFAQAPAQPPADAPLVAPAPSTPATPPETPGATPAPKAGTVSVTTRAPEPDRWVAQNDIKNKRRVFTCKPLACADKIVVGIAVTRSPTRDPNPQALEKFAKVDLPKSIRAGNASREVMTDGADKVETLVAETTTQKGYPAVANESKYLRGETAVYAATAIIFAGPVMVNIKATSPDLAVAQKYLKAFIAAMDIKEGPPAPPGTPAPATPGGKAQNI